MNALISIASQTTTTADLTTSESTGVLATVLTINLVLLAITLIALWKIFVKMGEPGWKGLIPIYNAVIILNKAGRSGWLLLLNFVPCVGQVIVAWLLADSLGGVFGKGVGYKLCLFFFPGLMHLILGFGSSQAVNAQAPASI
ncbi:MAG: DUF5684 domain-containing protein [Actinomycetes bacterium]